MQDREYLLSEELLGTKKSLKEKDLKVSLKNSQQLIEAGEER